MARSSSRKHCAVTWAWTSFRARRKLKIFLVREFARRISCAVDERISRLAGWPDEDHGTGRLRHSAGGLERNRKRFCRDARGKLHHHVAHFAVLRIEDAGA